MQQNMKIPLNRGSGDVGEFFQEAFLRCPVTQNFPWQAVAPVLDVADRLFGNRANRFAFRNEPADESVVALIRSTFAGGVGMCEENLRLLPRMRSLRQDWRTWKRIAYATPLKPP